MKKLILLTIFLSSLSLAQNPEWIIYNTSNSLLPSNNVSHIVVDNYNRKWVAFWNNGALKINGEDWVIYNTSNSNLPFNNLNAITVDGNSNFWAGSYYGNIRLTKFDGNNWTNWDTINSPIPEDCIMSLIFDNQNNLWLLCMPGPVYGMNYLLELTNESVWNVHTSFTNFIGYRQMLVDQSQIVWIGDWHGLYKYDRDTLIYIQGHPGQYCTDIKQDSVGNIWLATGASGWGCLVKYDGVSFTSYSNIQAISIEVDTLGNLWVGTESFSYEAELIKYDGINWTTYNPQNSDLPETFSITDLAFDKFYNLWIGTDDSGLVVFNENGIVVPVALQNFTAELIREDVHLSWTTATETNNSGFEIEKLQDSKIEREKNWAKIGFVEGHGTTTEPQFYSFPDETLQPGKYQYRLKQIDFDGSFEFSKVVEVTIESPNEFSLSQNYPNPFNPSTKIKYTIPTPPVSSPLVKGRTKEGFVTLKVYDVLGNEVATLVNEEKSAGEYEVEFSVGQDSSPDIASGIYFYQLKAANYTETKKMILLK